MSYLVFLQKDGQTINDEKQTKGGQYAAHNKKETVLHPKLDGNDQREDKRKGPKGHQIAAKIIERRHISTSFWNQCLTTRPSA